MLRRPTPRHNRGRIHVPSGSSPHPALAFGNAIAVWELDDPAVELNGSDVSKVPNRINPGTYDLVQLTASQQPLYGATAWGGTKPAMVFDGSADVVTATGLELELSGTDVGWGCVIAWDGVTSSSYDALIAANGGGSATHWVGVRDTNIGLLQRHDGTIDKTDLSLSMPGFSTRNVTAYAFNGTTDSMRHNAGSVISGSDRDTGAMTFSSVTVGAKGSGNYANVAIGALWFYSSLTDMAGAIAAMVDRGYGYA